MKAAAAQLDVRPTGSPSLTMSTLRVIVHLPSSGPISASDFVAYANGERVQVCRASIVRLSERVPLELHLAQSSVGPKTLAELQVSSGCIPVLVLPAQKDVVRAQLSDDYQALAPEVAAAVGVMQAAWSWDDRAELPVEINGVRFGVGPTYQGESVWDVTVAT